MSEFGLTGAMNGSTSSSSDSSSGGGSSVGGMLGSAAGSMAGPFGTALGTSLGGWVGSLLGSKKQKAPKPPTGVESGQWANDYYNTAFPGTTPWERLGTSNPAGGIAEGSMSSQTATATSNAEREQSRRQLATESGLRMADLSLRKYEIDTNAKLKNREVSLLEGQQSSKIQQQEYGSIPSALKSITGATSKVFGDVGDTFNAVRKRHAVEAEIQRNKWRMKANTKKRRINVKVNGR